MAAGLAIRPRGKRDQADRGQARTRRDRTHGADAAGARRLSGGDIGEGGAITVFAPAKINLYLHVVGRRADGYHLLDSLIAFADIGDRITAAPAATLSLTVGGPEADALDGLGGDNLVLRAARHLQTRDGVSAGAALHLDKHLPAASGIGGGSSDAAATLRALAALWDRPLDPAAPATAAWAAVLGADVPACLAATPLRVGGIGEILDPAGPLPAMGIVLANPRRPLPTAAVFRARQAGLGPATKAAAIPRDPAAFATMLAECRNDLTEAAIGLVPEIAAVLDRLEHLRAVLLARMSGSGATCFALFADRDTAARAGAALAAAEPGWWVRAGTLLSDQPGG
jgi:4-diphosphocytidyl-2-C-methyl-D-erythritol kinase